MENYKLTIEDGVITWVENADDNVFGRVNVHRKQIKL